MFHIRSKRTIGIWFTHPFDVWHMPYTSESPRVSPRPNKALVGPGSNAATLHTSATRWSGIADLKKGHTVLEISYVRQAMLDSSRFHVMHEHVKEQNTCFPKNTSKNTVQHVTLSFHNLDLIKHCSSPWYRNVSVLKTYILYISSPRHKDIGKMNNHQQKPTNNITR